MKTQQVKPKSKVAAARRVNVAKRTPLPAGRRPRETLDERKARANRILAILHKLYPDATCALQHKDPLQLLVATILSAQCTDTRVNIVTPELFRQYRKAADFARADPGELERQIQST